MSTIEQIEFLLGAAQAEGYRVRHDYFGGTGGGICTVSGTRWIFIDLALTSGEQLSLLENWMHAEPALGRAIKQLERRVSRVA